MNRSLAPSLVWFALVCVCANACLAAEKPLLEVRSPHFRVLTDGSDKDARRVAREFEQMRGVFAIRFPTFRLDSAAPLLIFAIRDEESFKMLLTDTRRAKVGQFAGYYQQRWEKQYAMVRLDQDKPGSYQVVYHEYVHSIIHMNTRWLPTWMDEGLAEFFGNSRFEGDKVHIGYPSSTFLSVQGRALIPISKLILITNTSPHYNDPIFYADSWALIHFMQFGPGMERGAKMDRFLTLLDQGMEQPKAFAQVFGDTRKMDDALQSYLSGLTLPDETMHNLPKFDDKDFATRVLTVAESEAELGAYHLFNHDNHTARELLESALKDDPKLGVAHEYMAMLNFNEGKDADAEVEFEQAYQLDPSLYLSLFFKTMMSPMAKPDFGGDRGQLYTALLKVITVRHQFAPAYVQLAFYHLRNGNLANALLMAEKAQQSQPSRAGYYLLIGRILQLMGKPEDAAFVAKYVADRFVGSDHNEAVELWNSLPMAQRSLSDVLTYTYSPDAKHVEGTIRSVSCPEKGSGADVEVVLDHGGESLRFSAKSPHDAGFSDTLWYGEDHFDLCHHLESLRAIAVYKAPSKPGLAGDLEQLEVRVDPPPVPTRDVAAKAVPNN